MISAKVFILAFLPIVVVASPKANLTSGLWTGFEIEVPEVSRKVEAFLGVRYAEPPLGDLRFRYPVPRRYSGEQDATMPGDACIQGDTFFIREGISFHFNNTSEDCLHMNIYRPKDVTDAPIAVYLYGGSFLGGFNGLFLYDPEELVARHDIIVVTINYRLSVLGFMYLNNTEAPGNQGLYDMLLGVQFVKENAKAMGGDPNKMTLWGQSAGSFAVGFFMASPKAKGLFTRAILQSGNPIGSAAPLRLSSLNSGVAAASVVDCVDPTRKPEDQFEDIARCMKKVDARVLFDAVDKKLGMHYTITFQPRFGIDDILPGLPYSEDESKMLLNSDIKEVFTSTVLNEGGMFIEGILERFQFGNTTSAEDYISLSRIVLKILLQLPIEYIRDSTLAYLPPELEDVDQLRDRMGQMLGDLIFECPADMYSSFLAKRGVKVYRYLWAQRPIGSYWPKWMQTTHCDDITYTMGSQLHLGEKALKANQASGELVRLMQPPVNEEHKNLVLNSLKMIADFIKTGVPSRPEGTDWPVFTEKQQRTLRIETSGFTEFEGPRTDKCGLWKDFLYNKVPARSPIYDSFAAHNDLAEVKNNTISKRPRKFKKRLHKMASTSAAHSGQTNSAYFISSLVLLVLSRFY